MKGVKIVLLLVLITVMGVGVALAAQHEASVDKGKALFNDSKLGTSGKTCNACHADGKGMEKAGAKADLVDTINMCITKPLKGKALDAKSAEMQSLVLYIKSIGEKKPAAKPAKPAAAGY